MAYTWLEYYKNAYEAQKAENNRMISQLAYLDNKQQELQEKMQKITRNPLYVLGRTAKKLTRIPNYVRNLNENRKNSSISTESLNHYKRAYQEKLEAQKDSYAQWILEQEGGEGDFPYKTQYSCVVREYGELANMLKSLLLEDVDKEQTLSSVKRRIEEWKNQEGIPGKETVIWLFGKDKSCFNKNAKEKVAESFETQQDQVLLYGAEDQVVSGKRKNPWFKPKWSPNTLLSFFYFGSYFAVKDQCLQEGLGTYPEWAATAFREQTGFWEGKNGEENALVYSFCLHLTRQFWETGREKVGCVDALLYHAKGEFTEHHGQQADAEYFLESGETKPLQHPEYIGYEREHALWKQVFLKECLKITSDIYNTYHSHAWTVLPKTEDACEQNLTNATVSVVIPSKDHPQMLITCITSLVEKTRKDTLTKHQVEILVVDNGSTEENRKIIADFLEKCPLSTQYIYKKMEFNFSGMCNMGVEEAKGEYVLLLNDDIEIIEENWLRIMLGQALLPQTGAVGAKLWYPRSERIQHAGITNLKIGPSHKLVTFPDDRVYYYGHNVLPYDMIAVTAACLLVKKEIYRQVGGMDESMRVAYNDVDFCFRIYEAGYYNVQRNDAVLLHHESVSRGLDEQSKEKWDRLLQEKAHLYEKHPWAMEQDPFYGEYLVDHAPDYRIAYKFPYDRPFLTVKPKPIGRAEDRKKRQHDSVMLTVEYAALQQRLHTHEPYIYKIEGWCYKLHGINSCMERYLILESVTTGNCYQLPVQDRNRPDVTAILPTQTDIELAGFTCRILKQDLINATCSNDNKLSTQDSFYVGMLYKDLSTGKLYYNRSDKILRME